VKNYKTYRFVGSTVEEALWIRAAFYLCVDTCFELNGGEAVWAEVPTTWRVRESWMRALFLIDDEANVVRLGYASHFEARVPYYTCGHVHSDLPNHATICVAVEERETQNPRLVERSETWLCYNPAKHGYSL